MFPLSSGELADKIRNVHLAQGLTGQLIIAHPDGPTRAVGVSVINTARDGMIVVIETVRDDDLPSIAGRMLTGPDGYVTADDDPPDPSATPAGYAPDGLGSPDDRDVIRTNDGWARLLTFDECEARGLDGTGRDAFLPGRLTDDPLTRESYPG